MRQPWINKVFFFFFFFMIIIRDEADVTESIPSRKFSFSKQ